MRRWHEEPGATEWRAAADAADSKRVGVISAEDLPGLAQGREEALLALRLMDDPTAPGAFTQARAAFRRALRVVPQSTPDQYCYETRWRGRTAWGRQGCPLEVCDRPTCGRCVPLRQMGLAP